MKRILLALILAFSFSSVAVAGSREVIEKYILEQKQVEPVKNANDGYLDRLLRYLGVEEEDKNPQLQEDRLKRANDALKNLHKFEPKK